MTLRCSRNSVHGGRWFCFIVIVLVVERKSADLDDFKLQRFRCKCRERLCHFSIEGFLAKTSHKNGNFVSFS